jgi:D-alanyl-D-alanine dipeptidase
MIDIKYLIPFLLMTLFICSFQNKTPKIEKPKGFEHLVDIQTINPTISIDLKYATTENFMHKQLYFNINRVYLQPDVALRLSNCQKFLKKINPSYSLLVYDGVRPLSVQKAMWEALDSIPPSKRGKFVSNPANGSVHNYGAAVDLTICDKNGTPIDMGAGYDDIREIAYPSKENYYLKLGLLKPYHIKNRKLLRKVMEYQQFRNIPSEWWHFNACSRKVAKTKYKIIQ